MRCANQDARAPKHLLIAILIWLEDTFYSVTLFFSIEQIPVRSLRQLPHPGCGHPAKSGGRQTGVTGHSIAQNRTSKEPRRQSLLASLRRVWPCNMPRSGIPIAGSVVAKTSGANLEPKVTGYCRVSLRNPNELHRMRENGNGFFLFSRCVLYLPESTFCPILDEQRGRVNTAI